VVRLAAGQKHTALAFAKLTAFCTHLPSDIPSLLGQAVAVVSAVNAEEADAKARVKDDTAPAPKPVSQPQP
jgi:hypothetical protein